MELSSRTRGRSAIARTQEISPLRNAREREGARSSEIANYVLAQSEINIAIGAKPPEVYFAELAEQCAGGKPRYGGITDLEGMKANFGMNCIPVEFLDGPIPEYDTFLDARRKLMAARIREYFEKL